MDINVGDTVEVLRDNPSGSYWKKGETYVVSQIVGAGGDMIYGNKPGRSINYARAVDLRKVTPAIDDDVIRVGDTLATSMCLGCEYLVLAVNNGNVDVRITKSPYGGTGEVLKGNDIKYCGYKKIKSGSDSTPATNTHTNEVLGEPQSEGNTTGKGCAVGAYRSASKVAVVGQYPGAAVRHLGRRSKAGGPALSPAPVRTSHL